MKLTGITDRIARLDALTSQQAANGRTTMSGLLNAAKPAIAAALAARWNGPVVLVTPHPHTARDLGDELALWTEREVRRFPALDVLPWERGAVDRAVLAEREAAARSLRDRQPPVLVAPARALLQPIQADLSALERVTFQVGEEIARDRLLAHLVETGYSPRSVVDEPGAFAQRGGVIDVFPAGAAEPVRVELFGNEIESLRAFDPATQRSSAPIARVEIPPIARVDPHVRKRAVDALMEAGTEGMNAEAETRWLEDLGRLEAGAPLDELAMFAPYLTERPTSLLELLPSNSLLIVDSASETWATLDELWQQGIESQRSLEERGDIPSRLRPALLQPDGVRALADRLRCIEWQPGSAQEEGSQDLSGLFLPARLYAGRLRAFVHDLAANPARSTVVVIPEGERIKELLAEENLPVREAEDVTAAPEAGVTLISGTVSEGWSLPSEPLLVVTDHELFGRARVRPVQRRPRAPRETFFNDLSPGDYVVHLEHGIGRFESVVRMTIEGAEREYALIQYAGADRVYVPMDQLERLTRYIGVGETPPHLNKLGGGEWQRARTRARQAADEIAGELVDIYAKRRARPGHAFAPDTPWQQELEAAFAYPETPDQVRAIEDVKTDMETARPMDRLVCADVGYGKTEVAVRAAFKALMDGKQVAVLVPTTILAQQHFETFSERFAPFPIRVEVLSRFRPPAEQREVLKRAAAGEVDVLIGTHRLLQKDVTFKNLGLLVIDEEQRFGVKHKEQLKKLRESVDVLTLTATPIPRTLHMGLVGIREISVIETPPEGRLPIKTFLEPWDDRLVRQAVLRELDRDGQVYIVHNRVATIEAMAERVRQLAPEARVLVAHGQMDEAQLERAMLKFAHGEADVLICSTIIENGLDIPNVNTIVVNNAHRLGLTQLYQLRGRVGRSANQAYAYLLYPRDVHLTYDAQRRMEAVFEAQDLGAGFSIAMKDLEIRGAGNLLGAEQSGHAAAVGFDLYTRMIAEAVERLRGITIEEPPSVTIDLPLTAYLDKEWVASETERLNLYRRLAGVSSEEELQALAEELRDRFGPLPAAVQNLITSVHLKLLAREARVSSVSLSGDQLILRAEPGAVYDRVSLYRRYQMEAKISTNVLRIARNLLEPDWVERVEEILRDMVRLRSGLRQAAPAS